MLWLKYAQWYAIFTGLYWPCAVIGVFFYAATPRFGRRRLAALFGRRGGLQSGAEDYIGSLDRLPQLSARLEIFGAAAWQLFWAWLFGWTWGGWLACYAAFGFAWSSLQYTDHAFSPFDCKNGAWNLRVPRWLRAVFLNYHLHLAHHRHPELSWRELPRHAAEGPHFFRRLAELLARAAPSRRFSGIQTGAHRMNAGLPHPYRFFFVLAALFALLFLAGYGGSNLIAAYIPWHISPALLFESAIPFLPAWSAVYLTVPLLLAASVRWADWRETWALFAVLTAELAAACPFSSSCPFRRPIRRVLLKAFGSRGSHWRII